MKNQAALPGHFGLTSTALCFAVEDVGSWGVFRSTVWRGVQWLVGNDWLKSLCVSLWFVRWCPGQCPWSSLIEAWFLWLRVESRCDPALMHPLGLQSRTVQICAKTKQLLFLEGDFANCCCLWVLFCFVFAFCYHFSCFISPTIVQFTHVYRMNFISHL